GVQGGAALEAAEGVLERLPAADEIPARLAAARVGRALPRRTGDLDAAKAAAARAGDLLEEVPASRVARHPEIHAQVQSGRGAVELWSGDLDQAAATLSAAIAASAPGGTYEQGECLGSLALVEALHGRLSHVVELARLAAAAESSGDGLAEFTSPAATVAL